MKVTLIIKNDSTEEKQVRLFGAKYAHRLANWGQDSQIYIQVTHVSEEMRRCFGSIQDYGHLLTDCIRKEITVFRSDTPSQVFDSYSEHIIIILRPGEYQEHDFTFNLVRSMPLGPPTKGPLDTEITQRNYDRSKSSAEPDRLKLIEDQLKRSRVRKVKFWYVITIIALIAVMYMVSVVDHEGDKGASRDFIYSSRYFFGFVAGLAAAFIYSIMCDHIDNVESPQKTNEQ